MSRGAADDSVAARLGRQLLERGETLPETTYVRLHRAISWLGRAEREEDDLDTAFLLHWIAFNAAYAHEFDLEQSERERMDGFIAKLLAVDAERALHQVLFATFVGPIRTMIKNRYVYEPFWRAWRERDPSEAWKEGFERSTRVALRALMQGDTARLLSLVIDRLYVLRNQIVHGGATWDSSLNREQLRDGTRLLQALVPVVIGLMLEHPEVDFGEVLYPPL